MKKCVIVPDSFKGSLSAIEFCDIAAERVRAHFPACEVIAVPVADGGEGTVQCFLHALSGERIGLTVQGPCGDPVAADYARFGKTAVVEMAQAAGLPLAEGRLDPSAATTYGVGQLIAHAVEAGCADIVVALGGSCTNDAGCGMAAALGARFLDRAGGSFVPTGATLDNIAGIDLTAVKKRLAGCTVTAMCDIDNPMFGPTGAAHVFGPQKGADRGMVERLDGNLRALDAVIRAKLGRSVAEVPGAGAAGAMGAGVLAFLGGSLKPGIETVLDLVGFEGLLEGADMVLTGEGKIDAQSLRGKVVIGVARRAAARGVPVTAVVGDVGDDAGRAYEMGVTAIFSINRVAVPFELARPRSKRDLRDTLDAMMRFYQAARRQRGA